MLTYHFVLWNNGESETVKIKTDGGDIDAWEDLLLFAKAKLAGVDKIVVATIEG
jgi:hypothetical protein